MCASVCLPQKKKINLDTNVFCWFNENLYGFNK